MSEPNFDRFDLIFCDANNIFGMPSCRDSIRFVSSSMLESMLTLAFCLTWPQKSLAIWKNDWFDFTATIFTGSPLGLYEICVDKFVFGVEIVLLGVFVNGLKQVKSSGALIFTGVRTFCISYG